MNVRPLHDRIIVDRLEEGEQHSGRIIIPDSAKEKPQQGMVIATGSGRATKRGDARVPLDVKTGDLVLFGKYSGQEIKLDGKDYLIMKEEDVLAVIESAAKSVANAAPKAAVKKPRKKIARKVAKKVAKKSTPKKAAPKKRKSR